MATDLPSVIYVDSRQGDDDFAASFGERNPNNDMDMMIDDDDMLDVTAEFDNQHYESSIPPATPSPPTSKSFLRQAPAVSFSSDSFLFNTSSPENTPSRRQRRSSSFFLRREGQTSLFPGSTNNNNSYHSTKFSYGGNTAATTSITNTCCTPSIPGDYGSAVASCSQASVSVPSTHLAAQYMEGMRRLSRSIRHSEMTRTALRREGVSLRSTPRTHSLPPDMLMAMSESLRSSSTPVSPPSPPLTPPTLVVADIEEHDDERDQESHIFSSWADAAEMTPSVAELRQALQA